MQKQPANHREKGHGATETESRRVVATVRIVSLVLQFLFAVAREGGNQGEIGCGTQQTNNDAVIACERNGRDEHSIA